ncbi:hypothetical protein D3C86_1756730 [compost metagenome]
MANVEPAIAILAINIIGISMSYPRSLKFCSAIGVIAWCIPVRIATGRIAPTIKPAKLADTLNSPSINNASPLPSQMPIGPITTSAARAPINSVSVGVNTVFNTSGMMLSTQRWI